MPRVNNVIQQVSQLNTYEQEKVFDFLKTVLMSNGITNSINEEIAENRFNKGKCCPFCNHDKISKYGKYHGKNGVAVAVNNKVHFPISEPFAVSLGRTLMYAYAVFNVCSLGLTGDALSAVILHLVPTVLCQLACLV